MVNNLIVCGGTFDHFHKGHESLLKLASSLGNKVIVGVTSSQYVRSSKLETGNLREIENFEKRKNEILDFVKSEKVVEKVKIVTIDDLFGPTLDKSLSIDAIVVSEETKRGAEIINQKRQRLGLGPLKVFIVPSVMAEDGKLISSARIRSGIINRKGRLYVNPLWFKSDLKLPEDLRRELKVPFGELIGVENLFNDKDFLVITVGDVTTKIFNEKSLEQNISVIDFKINREKKFASIKELGFVGDESIFYVDNPAGYISSNLFQKLSEIFQSRAKDKIIVQVNGEEDLAVLPLILISPLNTVIYYGQPSEGLVEVIVSESVKDKAYNFVSKFRPIKTHTRGY